MEGMPNKKKASNEPKRDIHWGPSGREEALSGM